jgi:uncharacterized membrane protein
MKKQKFEVKRTTEGTVFEVAFLLLAVVTWVIVVMLVNDAPDTIPTHFGLSGTPNSYGSKYELYFPCILTTVMGACCLAGAYFPHTVNIPGVPISNNRQAALAVRLLRVMGLLVLLLTMAIVGDTLRGHVLFILIVVGALLTACVMFSIFIYRAK